ncbi:hypothetical protein ACTRXD_08865 [Nitrospira sp. T9]
MKITHDQMASVIKALELHTGMNYLGSHGAAAEAEYACEACCTCG